MRILIAEDEKRLADALRFLLERESYTVDVVFDGQSACAYIESDAVYDLLILDIMMPQLNGLELLARIRKHAINTPVLLLTALSETRDKVKGLDTGADDYLTKPFQAEELLARVRALTRRTGEVILDELMVEDLTLDLTSHCLTCTSTRENHQVRLSEKEFAVLSLLMRNAGQTISKEQLLLNVWGFDAYVEDNNVEAYISFLRKKLRFVHSRAEIETIRSIGYVLRTPHQQG